MKGQHGCAVIPPYACPFQLKPGSKLFRPAARHFRLERFRGDPTPAKDLVAVDLNFLRAARDEDRAQLMLGTAGIKLRLVLELEQKM